MCENVSTYAIRFCCVNGCLRDNDPSLFSLLAAIRFPGEIDEPIETQQDQASFQAFSSLSLEVDSSTPETGALSMDDIILMEACDIEGGPRANDVLTWSSSVVQMLSNSRLKTSFVTRKSRTIVPRLPRASARLSSH